MRHRVFVDRLEDQRIVQAIRAAEARTRGEIRVHVTGKAVEDVKRAAAAAFEKLGMTATAERNGVLIFVSPKSRRFAVLGDTGIHQRCGDELWSSVATAISGHFRAGRFTEGLVAGIEAVAVELERHFPRRAGEVDRNELPDTVSRDE